MDSKTAKIVGEIVSVDDSTINLLFEIKTETGGETPYTCQRKPYKRDRQKNSK